jgi:carbonic anhydrase
MAALDHTIGVDTMFLAPWITLLEPAVARVAGQHNPLMALERESIIVSMERLRGFPFIAEAMRTRGLTVEGARYGVADGRLEVYDPATKNFQNVT